MPLVALDEAGYTKLVGLKGGYYAWNRCSSLSIAQPVKAYIRIHCQATERLHGCPMEAMRCGQNMWP